MNKLFTWGVRTLTKASKVREFQIRIIWCASKILCKCKKDTKKKSFITQPPTYFKHKTDLNGIYHFFIKTNHISTTGCLTRWFIPLYLFIRKIELWILKLANKSTNSFCFTYLSKGPSSDGTKDFKIIKPQISLWSWRPLRPFALSSSHFIKRWLETSSANSKFLFVLHRWGCVSTQKVCN